MSGKKRFLAGLVAAGLITGAFLVQGKSIILHVGE